MAAEGDGVRTFIFTEDVDEEDIPIDATHFRAHESVTRLPLGIFERYDNIEELTCHAGVERIEKWACYNCAHLGRLIIPGVRVVEDRAFEFCDELAYIECDELDRIGVGAFAGCISLMNINLPSAKILDQAAFVNCRSMTDVKFGKHLEAIRGNAFDGCANLERITIPLKDGLFPNDNVFEGCENFKHVDLIEEEVLDNTINALHLKQWKYDMYREFDSINRLLPDAPAEGDDFGDFGEKARVIRWWITGVLRKIIHYKAEHRRVLNEVSITLQHSVPKDIVMNNVLPFLELPLHTFEGEVYEDDSNGDHEEGRKRRRTTNNGGDD